MFYFLSIILSILAGGAIVFGQADYRNLEEPHSLEPQLLELQGGMHRLKEGGRLEPASDGRLVCLEDKDLRPVPFQRAQRIDRSDREAWLNRYKKSSICRAQLIQGRASAERTFVKVSAAAVLLIFLVGIMGAAVLLSPKRGEPLQSLTEAVERTN